MQKIKVGDMVKVLNIPGLCNEDYPEIVGEVFKVTRADVEEDSYSVENTSSYFSYYARDLELQSPKALNGHIWLIANKQTGKVIEGYQTRKEARENLMLKECQSDFKINYKIVKYTFN